MNKTEKDLKLQKLKQLTALPSSYSDWEFTSVLISRPLNYLVLKVIGDVDFITPNLITVLGFSSFLVASTLLYFKHFLVASVFLFLRLLLDDLDGMSARYKNQSSFFGSYLDKITDVFGFAVYFGVLGYLIYIRNHSFIPVFAAFISIFSLVVTGYAKWVVVSMKPTKSNVKDPVQHNFSLKNLLILFSKLFVVNECDLFLFSILFIVFGKLEWLLGLITISQILQMTVMVLKRGWEAHLLDQQKHSL